MEPRVGVFHRAVSRVERGADDVCALLGLILRHCIHKTVGGDGDTVLRPDVLPVLGGVDVRPDEPPAVHDVPRCFSFRLDGGRGGIVVAPYHKAAVGHGRAILASHDEKALARRQAVWVCVSEAVVCLFSRVSWCFLVARRGERLEEVARVVTPDARHPVVVGGAFVPVP